MSRFHRVLQEIVAEYLKSMGFKADIEVLVDDVHVADVYGDNGERTVIVEVETGYVPPAFIESAEEYIAARLTVKTYSYSGLADEFYIATPSYLRLPVPAWLARCSWPMPEHLAGLLNKFYGPRQLKGLLEGGPNSCKGLTGLMSVTISSRTVALRSLDLDRSTAVLGQYI